VLKEENIKRKIGGYDFKINKEYFIIKILKKRILRMYQNVIKDTPDFIQSQKNKPTK